MNVLELNFELGWRGRERQTIYNIEGFSNAGMNVSLVCRKGSVLEERALSQEVDVHTFKSLLGVIAHLISKGRAYDILHAQTPQMLTCCILTRPFHRSRVVLSRREIFKPDMFSIFTYKLADRVVAVSTSIKRVLKRSGVRDVAVIPDMVVESDSNDTVRKLVEAYKAQGKYIVATVSMLTQDKDPLTTVDIIEMLFDKRKDFVFLHFGGGELSRDVEKKIHNEGLEGVYKLMGFQKEIEPFYKLFDVFVMSSKQEGLGSSVLDAFINKVPVVGTNAGGLKELLSEGRGISCNVGAPSEIAEGINVLLDNDQLRRHTAQLAYTYAYKRHSVKAVTEQYHQLFKDLLN